MLQRRRHATCSERQLFDIRVAISPFLRPVEVSEYLWSIGNSGKAIQSGDTLAQIAADRSTSMSAILAANPTITDPNLVQVGQTIALPCAPGQASSPSPAPGPSQQCGSVTVKAGDSLSTIGGENGQSIGGILAANPSITDANEIQVGQVLALPCNGTQTLTVSPQEFNKTLNVSGFPGRNDTIRQDMLASIVRLGNTLVISSMTELAMFLSQVIHETGGLATLVENGGQNRSYAPYYGRGYIQLTGQANYAAASRALFNNETLLVNNPNLVAQNDSLAWDVSTWYWKTNVHSRPGISNGTFGISTRAINSIECQPGNAAAQHRCDIYTAVLPVLVPGAPQANCSGCTS